jgi:hypothetical protein
LKEHFSLHLLPYFSLSLISSLLPGTLLFPGPGSI